MENSKEKEFSDMVITNVMKEVFLKGWKMGLESIIIKVENIIMGTGLIIKNREMELIFIIATKDMKDPLKIIWSMEKVQYMKIMVIGIKDNSFRIKNIT